MALRYNIQKEISPGTQQMITVEEYTCVSPDPEEASNEVLAEIAKLEAADDSGCAYGVLFAGS